jgi:hypothetical protein
VSREGKQLFVGMGRNLEVMAVAAGSGRSLRLWVSSGELAPADLLRHPTQLRAPASGRAGGELEALEVPLQG